MILSIHINPPWYLVQVYLDRDADKRIDVQIVSIMSILNIVVASI